jgi:putative peptidoglycan lipid II flippase
MAAGTLASRITGLIRNLLFLRLGAGVLTNAYNLSNTSPNLFYELVVGGVLSATLVPLFVRLLAPADSSIGRTDRAVARDRIGASAVVTLAGAVVMLMSVALFLSAPWFLQLFGRKNTWAPGQFEFAVTLLRMFAPQVAIYGFVTLSTALLHSRSRFGITMAAPIINNVIVSAVFLWVGSRIDRYRGAGGSIDLAALRQDGALLNALGWGTTSGVIAMAVVTIPALRAANLGLRLVWRPQHPAVKELIRLSGWTFGYVASNQVALFFINKTLGANKGADQTVYTFANSVMFQLPHGIIAVSVIAGVQPALSRSFNRRKRAEFRRQLSLASRSLVCVMTPAAAGYVVLAKPMSELVAAHRNTSVAQAHLIGRILAVLAPGLPSFSLYLLFMGALKSMLDTRATFEVNVIENALNIVVGAVLYHYFGVVGLAGGFAIAYIVAAVLAGIVVSRRTAGIEFTRLVTTIGRTLVATGMMTAALLITGRLMNSTVMSNVQVIDLNVATTRFVPLLISVIISVLVGALTYLAAARMVGISELDPIVRRFKRLAPRSRTSSDASSDSLKVTRR